ncbi:MAG: nucleotidyltransferase family protein [Hyphomicrobiaceae bacterium]
MSSRPVTMIDTAMVLAAGLGTRMRPLTDTRPKPLVEVAGRSLLDRVLDRLAAARIGTVVINVHYLADAIEAAVQRRTEPRTILSDERQRLLDTGGGLRHALPLLGPGPFLVQNADCLWIDSIGSNLARLAAHWDEDAMDGLLLLAGVQQSLGYAGRGDFLMDSLGQLTRRPSRIEAPFAFTGCSLAHPRLLDGIESDVFSLNRAWDRAIENGRLFGIRLDGLWMHVGTPADRDLAERALTRGFD